jgi:hypothetical protein
MTATDDERRRLGEWFGGAIKQAREGDREIADGLLREFAHLGKNPGAFDSVGGVPIELLQYVATCIADWRKRGYRGAETWFYVERPDNRPRAEVIGSQICAMRAYMVLLARGAGKTGALAGAARYSGLLFDQVRYVTESHPERDVLEQTVMMLVTRRLRTRLKKKPPRKKHQRRP